MGATARGSPAPVPQDWEQRRGGRTALAQHLSVSLMRPWLISAPGRAAPLFWGFGCCIRETGITRGVGAVSFSYGEHTGEFSITWAHRSWISRPAMLRSPALRSLCLRALMPLADLPAIAIILQQSSHLGSPHRGPWSLPGGVWVSGHPQTTPWEGKEEDGKQNADGL